MKSWLKSVMFRTPYQVVRKGPRNRFQAIDDALTSLRRRGFAPRRVIDGGANLGEFSGFALNLFPETIVHAIEPQPGCWGALDALRAKSGGRLTVHPVALGSPEQEGTMLRLAADATSTSTGAHVVVEGQADVGLNVPCTTLDSLLAGVLKPGDGALLKLDLQGYELNAMRGATKALESCDIILTEVSFYAQAYEPPISELMAFLSAKGFELYDIASLYARPRDDRPRQGDFIFVRSGSPLMEDTSWS
jgi:FkbM family methyltransferase